MFQRLRNLLKYWTSSKEQSNIVVQNSAQIDKDDQEMNTKQFHDPLLFPSLYIVHSDINQRENNEDSFLICDLPLAGTSTLLKVLAIADGMGGYAYGELVSQEALRRVSVALFEQLCIAPAINQSDNRQVDDQTLIEEKVAPALWSAIEQANMHVCRMVQTNRWGKAGSTIVVTAILRNTAVVANLGDSPLFHYQASNKLLQRITEDHTIAAVLMRAGKITPEMARYHEGRSRLEFFVGAEKLPKKTPVHTVRLAPGDLLLLCTDGVSAIVPTEKISAILSDPEVNLDVDTQIGLDAIAGNLFTAARQVGETDNQTVILWRHGKIREIPLESAPSPDHVAAEDESMLREQTQRDAAQPASPVPGANLLSDQKGE